MIDVIQIPILSDNYSYLIIDKKSKVSGCIDPSVFEGVQKVLEKRNIRLDFILNTHHHNDHVGGNLQLKEKHNCKIIGSFSDQDRIPGIDIKLKEGDKYKIGESTFSVIETPGHTIGHICFYFAEQKILFSGDTVFSLGCGRVFEGTHEQMTNSILKIRSLPKETKIYCGHEYTESNANFVKYLNPDDPFLDNKIIDIKKKRSNSLSTIPCLLGDELKLNPFLRFDDEKYLRSINLKSISMVENFKKIRVMKDEF